MGAMGMKENIIWFSSFMIFLLKKEANER